MTEDKLDNAPWLDHKLSRHLARRRVKMTGVLALWYQLTCAHSPTGFQCMKRAAKSGQAPTSCSHKQVYVTASTNKHNWHRVLHCEALPHTHKNVRGAYNGCFDEHIEHFSSPFDKIFRRAVMVPLRGLLGPLFHVPASIVHFSELCTRLVAAWW